MKVSTNRLKSLLCLLTLWWAGAATARQPPVKVLFDSATRQPGWTVTTVEGAIQRPSAEGFEFTLEEWSEGRAMWPRLSFQGPALDLSGYTKLLFEVENKSATPQNIAVAARSTPDETAALAAPLGPGAVTRVLLDISDGAQVDQSNVNEIYLYMTRPPQTATFLLRRISAVANPDFISRRAALGQQIARVEQDFKALNNAAPGAVPPGLAAAVDALRSAFEAQKPGYAGPVQKQLLDAENAIARAGMTRRGASLVLWQSPLGLPIREGTLPAADAPDLKAVAERLCLNQYKAVAINLSAAERPHKVRLSLAGDDTSLFSLKPTYYVKARDGSMTADAIGQSAAEVAVDIPAWGTQQVLLWLDTKRPAARAGRFTARLKIAIEGQAGREVPLAAEVADVRLASQLPVSVSNWAYFYMGSTKVTEGLEKEAVANLRDYGANTWNLDYSQIPLPVVDAAGNYAGLEPATLKRLQQVLGLLKGVPGEEFVVWLGFQRAEIREALARPGVLEGYLKDLRQVLDSFDIPGDRRYLMLWDEPKLPEVRETLQWMRRIRAIDPTFKFYENGSEVPEGDELRQLADHIDRWLPNWEQLYIARPQDAGRLLALKEPDLGFYRCLMSRNNRGVNIYEYYRLMGWYAMQHGFGTVAFWVHNVADGDAWDGTTGTSSGGVVVYQRDGKLLTSRRWELFREGLDDYRVAQAAAGVNGLLDARQHPNILRLCEDVANNPTDYARAGEARDKLISVAVQRK